MKKEKEIKRCAKMLLASAGSENEEKALAEITAFSSLLNQSRGLSVFLAGPQFTLNEKETIIKKLSDKAGFSPVSVKFIKYLSQISMIQAVPEIARTAAAMYLEKKKKAKAVVMTPTAIDKAQVTRLRSALKKLTERDIDIDVVTDPSLLGGILVRVGSTMYDSSIKGQLRLLKDELSR